MLENNLQHSLADVGDNFYTNLKHQSSLLTLIELGNAGARIDIIQSEFQADSTVAHRCFRRISNIVFTSDSDLAALCGCQCVVVKEFTFKENCSRNNRSVKDIKIFTPADYSMIQAIARSIHFDLNLQSKNHNTMYSKVSPISESGH
jgi:hypothetical protein